MNRTQRLAMVAVALVIVVVGFIVLRPGSDNGDNSSTTTQTNAAGSGRTGTNGSGAGNGSGGAAASSAPKVATITVVNGQPKGGIQQIVFARGDQIRIKVNSDTADEVHIHGYDFHKNVAAGGSVSFSFPASIEGRFVIELENAKQQLAELQVNP